MGNIKSDAKLKTLCNQSLKYGGDISSLTGLKTGAQASALSSLNGSGTSVIGIQAFNDFTLVMTGDTTLSMTASPPAGYRFYISIDIQSAGFALTWFAGSANPIFWDLGVPPDFTSNPDQTVVLWTDDGGANWYGKTVHKKV